MSRMLSALRQLDARRPAAAGPAAEPPLAQAPAAVPPAEPAATSEAPPEPVSPLAPFVAPPYEPWTVAIAPPALAPVELVLPSWPAAGPAEPRPAEVRTPRARLLWDVPETTAAPRRLELDLPETAVMAYDEPARGLLEAQRGNGPQALLLVPPARLRQVDFSALLLAAAVARPHDGQVLLIDAGGSESRLPKAEGPGLAEVWSGRAGWREVIWPTNIARLSVVRAGQSEADYDSGLRELSFESLYVEYPLVLVAAGAVESGTAWRLAPRCQGVYLVVCLGATGKAQAAAARRRLEADGARLLGTIVTASE